MNLKDEFGKPLNAMIELHELGIVIHSRSGTSRNRDYREALELIMQRLDSADVEYEIYQDSNRVQDIPLRDRRLSFNKIAPIAERFDLIVRAMNQGTSSHGAWRRLLIATPGVNPQRLPAIIRTEGAEPGASRLPSTELRKVRVEHVVRAAEFLLNGGDAPNFSHSRDYDAMTANGIPLAPKKVFGIAIQEALGIEAFPAHFSSGWGQVSFDLLEKAGLWIVPKGTRAARRPATNPSKMRMMLSLLTPTEEERTWIEGNPRIVSHLIRERQPGLAKQKRQDFLSKHGRLFCEDCGLDPVKQYGKDAGPACIEVHHHHTHVADMKPGHVSTVGDLKCLCANCHRVLHRKLTLGLFS